MNQYFKSNLFSKSIAEMIGTFAISFFGCGFVVVSGAETPQMVPFVFGATITIMIYATGHLSGAHFNPAVTLAFASVKRFPYADVPSYLTFQVLGALLGLAALWACIPEISQFATTQPQISVIKAFALEVIFSFFLMFVIISVATDSRAVGMMAGLAIGTTVTICAFMGGPLTGASMNPARSLAPAIFENQFDSLWLYLLAPIVGACLAAFTYEKIRCDNEIEKNDAKGCC